MILKIFKDVILLTFLFIAMTKIGNTQELMSDDGGVRLKNGCYTMVIVVDGDHGKRQITIQDCRGGRSI
tara:strand:+ start:301 stop:507 length:207 start_codon:yes stop_codon:yes gene_type:complete